MRQPCECGQMRANAGKSMCFFVFRDSPLAKELELLPGCRRHEQQNNIIVLELACDVEGRAA